MPYAPISKQKQEELNQPKPISGGGGASFQDVVPGQEKSQKSSGQYANLQQYIQANQPQAQEMGQKVAGDVQSKASEAESKLGQFEQAKPQAVQAFDPNQYIQDAPRLSQEQKTQFQQQRKTGGYTGPQQLEQVSGYKEAQQAAQKASDAAKMAGTETGQQDLLKQTFARPSYTQGQVKLDQVLLGGNQQAKQGLSDLSQRYSGLYDQFNTKAQEAGSAINQANQQALANKQAIEAAIPKAFTDLLNPIEERARQQNLLKPQIQQEIFGDISDDALLESTLQRLGLSEGQKLYDVDLASYLTPNQTQLGVNDVANADERAKYKALADLFQDQTRTQIGDQGLSQDAFNFDKQRFERDVQAKGQEYERAYNSDRIFPGGATAKEMEEYYIPRAQAMVANATNEFSRQQLQAALNNAVKQVQDFKNSYKINRSIGRQS